MYRLHIDWPICTWTTIRQPEDQPESHDPPVRRWGPVFDPQCTTVCRLTRVKITLVTLSTSLEIHQGTWAWIFVSQKSCLQPVAFQGTNMDQNSAPNEVFQIVTTGFTRKTDWRQKWTVFFFYYFWYFQAESYSHLAQLLPLFGFALDCSFVFVFKTSEFTQKLL